MRVPARGSLEGWRTISGSTSEQAMTIVITPIAGPYLPTDWWMCAIMMGEGIAASPQASRMIP